MSSHVWDVKVFKGHTVRRAREIFLAAIDNGLNYGECCQAVGYIMERVFQAGEGERDGFYLNHRSFDRAWARGRYTTGVNAKNYLLGGERLLQAVGALHGLKPVTPPMIVWDWIQENLEKVKAEPPQFQVYTVRVIDHDEGEVVSERDFLTKATAQRHLPRLAHYAPSFTYEIVKNIRTEDNLEPRT